jgi:predicted DNA-binding transcriptional regulator YafY
MSATLSEMRDTSGRLLRLLSLLQARPDWTGPALADRLEVTVRSVRRDIDRLRQLGYPVDARPGVSGGYRLGTGTTLPPLLLDDEEAAAVAIALGVTAGGAVRGIEEAALGALAKLDRLLPPHLRSRVEALRAASERIGVPVGDVDPDLLVTLAQAAASNERVVISYSDRAQRQTERRVDPYRLVATGRRWYLVAYDVDRIDWRTFRVDRVLTVRPTGHRFRIDDPPDASALVSRALSVSPYRYAARVIIAASAEAVRQRVPATAGMVEALGPDECLLTTGSDYLDVLAGHLVSLGARFQVLEPAELRDLVRSVGRQMAADHPAG